MDSQEYSTKNHPVFGKVLARGGQTFIGDYDSASQHAEKHGGTMMKSLDNKRYVVKLPERMPEGPIKESRMQKFSNWLEEKKKDSMPQATTATSSPIKGANQDQSGVGVKHSAADYTISDATVPTPTPRPAANTVPMPTPRPADLDAKKQKTIKLPGNAGPYANVTGMTTIESRSFNDVIRGVLTPGPLEEGRPKKNATEDDPGGEHPIAQLRKIVSMRGQVPFKHVNPKQKSEVDVKTAHQLLAKHDNMKTSAEKQEFAARLHKSPEEMQSVIRGEPAKKKPKVSLGGSALVGGIKE